MSFRILSLALLLLPGCVPTAQSFRPRGVDVYAENGRSRYTGERSSDVRFGISVHFDLTYADEYEDVSDGE